MQSVTTNSFLTAVFCVLNIFRIMYYVILHARGKKGWIFFFPSRTIKEPTAQTFLNKKFLLQKENLTMISPIYLLTKSEKWNIFYTSPECHIYEVGRWLLHCIYFLLLKWGRFLHLFISSPSQRADFYTAPLPLRPWWSWWELKRDDVYTHRPPHAPCKPDLYFSTNTCYNPAKSCVWS